MEKIYVTRPLLPEIDEYITEIKEIFESQWLTNMGKKHSELENTLKDVLKVPNVSLFNNGTIALLTAIKRLTCHTEAKLLQLRSLLQRLRTA